MTVSRCCWKFRIKFLAVLISLYVAAAGGCSKPVSEVIGRAEAPAPATADEAVRNVLAGLQRQELQALWEFLPPAYRGDIENLVHEFGEQLDEKSWEPFVATCRKARTVISQLIRRSDESGEAANDSDRKLVAQLRDVEKLLATLCERELSEVARLRELNASRFLAGAGNQLIAAVSHGELGRDGMEGGTFSHLGEVQIGLSESTGDSAVLTVQWPGQEPTRHRFVCVEEHWIPQTLAEAWPTEFPKVRERCLAWADELRSNPEPWHARLREMDQVLDELAATKSLSEARQVWQAGASRLVVAWFGVTTIPDSPKSDTIPIEPPPPSKPARVKRPDTEVLLPDEPEK